MAIVRCAKCGKVISGGVGFINGKPYHKGCMVCAYCGEQVTGMAATYRGALYHTECNPASGKLVCAYCRKPISIGSYINYKGKHYHNACYRNHMQKVCCVCGQPISGTYTYDDWGNYAHTMHGSEKAKYCYSCGRIVDGSYRSIANNTVLCRVCAPISVTTDPQVEACRAKVLDVFKAVGITGIPERIPVMLRSKDLMGDALGCIHSSHDSLRMYADFNIEMTYGLPDIHFQGVLAHEMLHSWLILYGREVTDDEKEGFCNLGSAAVYQKTDSPHAKLLLKRLYKNEDTIYGDGYRLQKERYERLGWNGLLDSLKRI